MKAEFWHERWQENKIGFHRDEVNTYLKDNWHKLGVTPHSGEKNKSGVRAPATVFVPLCGKSIDVCWLLEQGYRVEAVELSPIAVKALIEEQALTAEYAKKEAWEIWQGEGFRIWCGDYFALTPELLGPVDAVYDRAALIALPEQMRPAYVSHMKTLTGIVPQLLITLSYNQSQMNGPPFSVTNEEVERLYKNDYVGTKEPAVKWDVLAENQKFVQRGVDSLFESVFLLQVPNK